MIFRNPCRAASAVDADPLSDTRHSSEFSRCPDSIRMMPAAPSRMRGGTALVMSSEDDHPQPAAIGRHPERALHQHQFGCSCAAIWSG